MSFSSFGEDLIVVPSGRCFSSDELRCYFLVIYVECLVHFDHGAPEPSESDCRQVELL